MRGGMSTAGKEATAVVRGKLEATVAVEATGGEGAGAIGPTATIGVGARGESTTGEAGGGTGAMAIGGFNAKYKYRP